MEKFEFLMDVKAVSYVCLEDYFKFLFLVLGYVFIIFEALLGIFKLF